VHQDCCGGCTDAVAALLLCGLQQVLLMQQQVTAPMAQTHQPCSSNFITVPVKPQQLVQSMLMAASLCSSSSLAVGLRAASTATPHMEVELLPQLLASPAAVVQGMVQQCIPTRLMKIGLQ
jgi:hypothetical protein